MKKAIQGLLLGLLLVLVNFTSPALSEEQPQQQPGVSSLPVMVQCGSTATIMKSITGEFNEVPFAKMLVSFTAPSGQQLSGWGTIWVNATTGSWSYVVSFPDSDQVCYFLGGKDFGPAVKGQPS